MSDQTIIERKIEIVKTMAPNRGVTTIGIYNNELDTLRMEGCNLMAGDKTMSSGTLGEIVSWLNGVITGMEMIEVKEKETMTFYSSMFKKK